MSNEKKFTVDIGDMNLEHVCSAEFDTLRAAVEWMQRGGFKFNRNTGVVTGLHEGKEVMAMTWSWGMSVPDHLIYEQWVMLQTPS